MGEVREGRREGREERERREGREEEEQKGDDSYPWSRSFINTLLCRLNLYSTSSTISITAIERTKREK